MSDEKDKIIPNHEYDGIQEQDNPLPRWWLMTFYGTIIFAIGYFGYYQLGTGPGQELSFNEEYATLKYEQALKNKSEEPDEKSLAALLGDRGHRDLGAQVFEKRCISCHGPEGGGGIGPNLTDNFWINKKGTLEDIYHIIKVGVPEKGMPPWGGMLPPAEITDVTIFVKSLKGKSPANAKAPQGQEYAN